jgi:hypothetical protein
MEQFKAGLIENGLIERQNITIDYRSAEGDIERIRQQAVAHRLGGSRTRSLLSAEDRRHLTSKLGKRRLTNFNIDSFPAEVCEME